MLMTAPLPTYTPTALAFAFSLVANFLSPTIAFAESVVEQDLLASNDLAAAAPATELPDQTKMEMKADAVMTGETAAAPGAEQGAALESRTFVSDGTPVALETLGIKITPPAGWEVSVNDGSLSVVLREPKVTTPSYDKPKYQRNITVAAIHRASPIDETRAAELKNEMATTFGADSLVSSFQVIEHKFFNYRGANDGLLVYSSLNIGEYPMMQAHVLLSGQEKQFLLTYTDLAERFANEQDGAFAQAWSTMVSTDVTGLAPQRYEAYARYAAAGGGVFFLFGALWFLRRRVTRVDFSAEADAMIDSDDGAPSHSVFATLAHGWKIPAADGGGDDMSFSGVTALDRAKTATSRHAVSSVSTF
jgi:hypothetical protein